MYRRKISLPDHSDTFAAQSMRDELLSAVENGDSVLLDASHVERISTTMLQVLLSAKSSFGQAGLAFAIATPSQAFFRAVGDTALSLPLETTHHEEA